MTTSPTTQAMMRLGAGGAGRGLEGEGNEIADFVDERPQRVARGLPRGDAQLLGPLQGAITAVQQTADVHCTRVARRRGRGRGCDRSSGVARRRGRRAFGPGQELRERRGLDHASAGQPLVCGPRADEVGCLGRSLGRGSRSGAGRRRRLGGAYRC